VCMVLSNNVGYIQHLSDSCDTCSVSKRILQSRFFDTCFVRFAVHVMLFCFVVRCYYLLL